MISLYFLDANSLISYVIYKYFLPFGMISFHFLMTLCSPNYLFLGFFFALAFAVKTITAKTSVKELISYGFL